MNTRKLWLAAASLTGLIGTASTAMAGESELKIPDLSQVKFNNLGGITGPQLMNLGIVICFIGAAFGIWQYLQTKALPVHESMAKVSHSIYETCKTYLLTQGKLLAILWFLIARPAIGVGAIASTARASRPARSVPNASSAPG